MRVAKIGEIRQDAITVDRFRGYNHNISIGNGEFYREENLSSDEYPVLSVRGRRSIYAVSEERINGMCWLDGLWIAKGTGLYNATTGYFAELGLTDGKKQMVPIGSRIVVMPDGAYINTTNPQDFGQIGKRVEVEGDAMIEVDLVDESFNFLPLVYILDSPPPRPMEGSFWVDTSLTPPVLKKLEDIKWVVVKSNLRIEISSSAIQSLDTDFKVGARVRLTVPNDVLEGVVRKVEGNVLIISGIMRTEHKEIESADGVTLSQLAPIMDIVFEHNNRLWGCRYGNNAAGEFVNEIYASAQGDFGEWYRFDGASTDSYVLSCGTDGPWTGAMEVGGYPTFWKERYLHKIYGDYPAQYSCNQIELNGVAPGAANSMAIVDGVLYYNGMFGICRYDGSMPTEISEAFGAERYQGGVAGVLGKKCYFSFASALMVYDTEKRIWHKESPINASYMVYGDGKLSYCSAEDNQIGEIYTDDRYATAVEAPVRWYAETGIIATDYQRQRLQRIDLRVALEIGGRMRIMAEYDSSGIWEPISSQIMGRSMAAITVPLRPRRCDHLRLRLEGEGEMKLMKITYITEKGSDIR